MVLAMTVVPGRRRWCTISHTLLYVMRKLLRHLYVLISCEVTVTSRERILLVMRRLIGDELMDRWYVRIVQGVDNIRHLLLGLS